MPVPAVGLRGGESIPGRGYGEVMKAISLFTGAGGLDIGCERAGFATIAAVEQNAVARQTLRANGSFFPELSEEAVHGDIVNLEMDRLLESAGVAAGDVDLVHGGPPCTPFSKSGYWLEYKRRGEDPKASLLDDYVRVLDAVKPRAFLMENVYALGYRNHNRPVFERFREGIMRAGYTFDSAVMLAADYGVPQLRQRLICVGVRNDLVRMDPADWLFDWPTPTHSGPHETRKGWDESLLPHVPVRQAFEGLSDAMNPPEPEERVEGTYADALAGVPPGDNYLFWTAKRGHPEPRFEWRRRYWSFLLKLHPEKPSPTIQGQPGPWVGPFHWENRRLRVGELKRLMTFPDEFRMCGSRRDHQLQLGNAVPPLLAQVIAAALAAELQRLDATEIVSLAA